MSTKQRKRKYEKRMDQIAREHEATMRMQDKELQQLISDTVERLPLIKRVLVKPSIPLHSLGLVRAHRVPPKLGTPKKYRRRGSQTSARYRAECNGTN